MKKSQYKKLVRIQDELCRLSDSIKNSKRDKLLNYGNGLESEQLGCAIAALECILQDVNYELF